MSTADAPDVVTYIPSFTMHAYMNVQCVEDTFNYAIGTNEMITAPGSLQSL